MLPLVLMAALLPTGLLAEFSCPDEFEGYYPHAVSCDKYYACKEGKAELETCGNGLAFADVDPTYTAKNCDYIHNIDCGNRTELEPAESAPNCPRLYGIFPDEEDCTAFFQCRDGISNRFSCAPGLAYDTKTRVCKWADQVPECKRKKAASADGGEDTAASSEEEPFECPNTVPVGIFSKHAHPGDCRQYFVCISGTPREYGCPLGTVFKVGKDEFDGQCADPQDVPECSNYYGDLAFDKQELVRAGVDPEAVGAKINSQGKPRVNRLKNRVEVDNDLPAPVPVEKEEETDVEEEAPVRAAPAPPTRVKSDTPTGSNVLRANRIRTRPSVAETTTTATTTTTTTTTTTFTTTEAALLPTETFPSLLEADEEADSLLTPLAAFNKEAAASPAVVPAIPLSSLATERPLLSASPSPSASPSLLSARPPPSAPVPAGPGPLTFGQPASFGQPAPSSSFGQPATFVSPTPRPFTATASPSPSLLPVSASVAPAAAAAAPAAVGAAAGQKNLGKPVKVKAGEDYYYYYYYDDDAAEGEDAAPGAAAAAAPAAVSA